MVWCFLVIQKVRCGKLVKCYVAELVKSLVELVKMWCGGACYVYWK